MTLGDLPAVRETLAQITPSVSVDFKGSVLIPLHPSITGDAHSFLNRRGQGEPCIAVHNLMIRTDQHVIAFDLYSLTGDQPMSELDSKAAQKLLGGPCLIDFKTNRLILHVTPDELPAELERLSRSEHLARAVLGQLTRFAAERRAKALDRVANLSAFDAVAQRPEQGLDFVVVAVPVLDRLPTLLVGLPDDYIGQEGYQDEPGFCGHALACALIGSFGYEVFLDSHPMHTRALEYRSGLETGTLQLTTEGMTLVFELTVRSSQTLQL